MKQNCKPLSQPRVLNGPHYETWTRHVPEITSRTQNLFLKPALGPEAGQDLRNRVAKQSKHY